MKEGIPILHALYITYCSKEKYDVLYNQLVTPAELYSSLRVQTFIEFCNRKNLQWAIFSDLYGLIFSFEKIQWYDKSPDSISNTEYEQLLKLTIKKLVSYKHIVFYYAPESLHPLYKRLISDLKKYKKIVLLERLE